MPKVDRRLLNAAVNATVDFVIYIGGSSLNRAKIKKVCELSGITRGQWKRMELRWDHHKDGIDSLRVTELTIKKLHVMAEHGRSPHLITLLKMVEAQEVS